MALVKCPECRIDVSDQAESCPKCGCPFSEKAQTIEKTSKKLKLQTMLSAFMAIIGFLIACGGVIDESGVTMILGIVVFAVSFIWFAVIRFLIWWHHG